MYNDPHNYKEMLAPVATAGLGGFIFTMKRKDKRGIGWIILEILSSMFVGFVMYNILCDVFWLGSGWKGAIIALSGAFSNEVLNVIRKGFLEKLERVTV
jgi:hypothetical protein